MQDLFRVVLENVIYTTLTEGVDFNKWQNREAIKLFFDKNEELSKIGDVDNYIGYLKTVFPNSELKDVVFHSGKSSKFLEGRYTYFTTEIKYANLIKRHRKDTDVYLAILDIRKLLDLNSKEVSKYVNSLEDYIKTVSGGRADSFEKFEKLFGRSERLKLQKQYDGGTKPGELQIVDNEVERLFKTLPTTIDGIIGTEYSSSSTKDYLKLSSSILTVVPRSANQIYILGSDEDTQGFVKFTESLKKY